MNICSTITFFSLSILNTIPDARAIIYGSSEYPNLYGIVNFYTARWETGIIIEAEISGPNTASYSPRFWECIFTKTATALITL